VAYLRNDKYLKSFGKHLKELREERKISQADLAFECDMEISQISRIERGVTNTSISNAYYISKALKVSTKDLFDF
jgi:transcriptional regulator with XRE-family HTH domain